ncbi:MAG: glucan biosynthesis protein, partial [Planctomycetota bacterium]
IIFPLGISLQGSSEPVQRGLYVLAQVFYAWLVSFGLIGLFHRFLSENRLWIRYVSDSSYWLYIAHLPLVLLIQYAAKNMEIPSVIKLLGICAITTGILLCSYQLFVRRTWIGVLLNGRRFGAKKD